MKRLSFAGFGLLLAACAVGTSGSTVRRTTPSGTIEHHTSAFGLIEPAPGASATEAAAAALTTAYAGCVDATCRQGFFPYGGYGYGYPIVAGTPIGGYTAAGAARAGEVLRHVGRAPNYTVIEQQDLGLEGGAAPEGAPPAVPPAPPPSGGGGGEESAPSPAAGACDVSEYIDGLGSFQSRLRELLRTEPLDARALKGELDAADSLLDEAEEVCAGNETAMAELRPFREDLDHSNREYVRLTRPRR